MKFRGKIALVTGSSRGIGEAIAIRLAQEGAKVIINYRSQEEEAIATKEKVEATGSQAYIVRADLSEISQIRHLVQESINRFGKIDILVNNAGLEKYVDFWHIEEEEYDQVMNVNLKGFFYNSSSGATSKRNPTTRQNY